jgi:uncharacterized membrane protein
MDNLKIGSIVLMVALVIMNGFGIGTPVSRLNTFLWSLILMITLLGIPWTQ